MSRPHFASADLPDPTSGTGGMVYVSDFDVTAYSDGTQWVLESDQRYAFGVSATFTEAGVYPQPSAQQNVGRIFAYDGKALWDAGWRPQARLQTRLDNATGGNNANAGVGLYDFDDGDNGVGALLDSACLLQSAGTTLEFKTSAWETFTGSPTQAHFAFLMLVGPNSAGTCSYVDASFEIRWVKT